MRELLKNMDAHIQAGETALAFARLRGLVDETAPFAAQNRLVKRLDTLPRGELGLKPLRLALVPTATLDQFARILRLHLAVLGFDAGIFLTGFNTLDQEILDPDSRLYRFNPELVWIFTSHRDVPLTGRDGASPTEVAADVAAAVARFENLWQAIQSHSPALIVQNNADLPLERVFGNFSGACPWSRLNRLRRFNLELADAAPPGVTLFDLDHAASVFGRAGWFAERFWYHSRHPFSLEAIPAVAAQAARLVNALKGGAKKGLVLDLDNTLWGGVIADDGLEGIRLSPGDPDGEAFIAFQDYLLKLKERGIILTVCSKNQEENARLPFEKHPHMRLRLADFAVFVANWDNKADNIAAIAETLEIGPDALVFVDDNPVERDLVRRFRPEVTVLEMPEDPALYVRTLDRAGLFETAAFSDEDRQRAEMYRQNASRKASRGRHADVGAFLRSLEMTAEHGPVGEAQLPRVAQLINKSNQFHLTTRRYSEADLRRMVADPERIAHWFRLRDRFGDNGLISVLLLRRVDAETLEVDTWVMSCRVLSRGMEAFVRNRMVRLAREAGCRRLIGVYLPTRKNGLVADLYGRLGFAELESRPERTRWLLEIDPATEELETSIRDIVKGNG